MDRFVKLAKRAVEGYIKSGRIIKAPENLSDVFLRKAGVFVTIRKGKELRGCVGTYIPTKENLAKEIIANAIAACSKDGRFPPMSKDELPELSYEVSVLNEPELLKNIQKHNPKRNGIIARCSDGRCGLLLPGLDGIDSVDQQISIACAKGGIDPVADNVQYFWFSVEKHI